MHVIWVCQRMKALKAIKFCPFPAAHLPNLFEDGIIFGFQEILKIDGGNTPHFSIAHFDVLKKVMLKS